MLIEHTLCLEVCTGLPTAQQVEFEVLVIMCEAVNRYQTTVQPSSGKWGEKHFAVTKHHLAPFPSKSSLVPLSAPSCYSCRVDSHCFTKTKTHTRTKGMQLQYSS